MPKKVTLYIYYNAAPLRYLSCLKSFLESANRLHLSILRTNDSPKPLNHRMKSDLELISLDQKWKYQWGEEGARPPNAPWYPAQPPPTNIHLDLMSNGSIPDPFLGKNEDLVQWVGDQTWTYQTTFSLPKDVFQEPNVKVVLVFGGLDTFATAKLNGRVILESHNMFLQHRVQITEDLVDLSQSLDNIQTLQLRFDPAERMGNEEVKKHPDHPWFTFNSGVSRLAVRKAQYHYVSSAFLVAH